MLHVACAQGGTASEHRWMQSLGCLLFFVEQTKFNQTAAVQRCIHEHRRDANNSLASSSSTVLLSQQPHTRQGLGRPGLPAGPADVAKRQRKPSATAQVVLERRAALAVGTWPVGLRYWVAKQRWLWRQNR